MPQRKRVVNKFVGSNPLYASDPEATEDTQGRFVHLVHLIELLDDALDDEEHFGLLVEADAHPLARSLIQVSSARLDDHRLDGLERLERPVDGEFIVSDAVGDALKLGDEFLRGIVGLGVQFH